MGLLSGEKAAKKLDQLWGRRKDTARQAAAAVKQTAAVACAEHAAALADYVKVNMSKPDVKIAANSILVASQNVITLAAKAHAAKERAVKFAHTQENANANVNGRQ